MSYSYCLKTIKQLLWWLIAGSDGGLNRARIIHALNEKPCNANKLAERLNLDYKTIRYHLDILEDNDLITTMGKKYGKVYLISSLLEKDYHVFQEIWEGIHFMITSDTGQDFFRKLTKYLNFVQQRRYIHPTAECFLQGDNRRR